MFIFKNGEFINLVGGSISPNFGEKLDKKK